MTVLQTGPVYRSSRDFDTSVQMVASAAHRRGVVLVRSGVVVGELEARDLCRTLRAAHGATSGRQRQHVENIAFVITLRLGVPGPILLARSQLNVLQGYAKRLGRGTPTPHLARGYERHAHRTAGISGAVFRTEPAHVHELEAGHRP